MLNLQDRQHTLDGVNVTGPGNVPSVTLIRSDTETTKLRNGNGRFIVEYNGSNILQATEKQVSINSKYHNAPAANSQTSLFVSNDTVPVTALNDGGEIRGVLSSIETEGDQRNNKLYLFAVNTNPTTGLIGEAYGYYVGENFANGNVATRLAGFYSDIIPKDNGRAFNFYTKGEAPNFYAGDTYIGGSADTTTRQIWESSLTEDQLERYKAGTLMPPGNVVSPGDGSFARLWWYNRQNSQTQSLIDSGSLGYPKSFAADTFTNTFDLKDTTNISLLSDGTAEFAGLTTHDGGVKVTSW